MKRYDRSPWQIVFPGSIVTDLQGSTPLDAITDEVLISEIWLRPELALRDRRLVTLTILALNGDERKTALHVKAALHSGELTLAELREVAIQVAFYAGWPTGGFLAGVIES